MRKSLIALALVAALAGCSSGEQKPPVQTPESPASDTWTPGPELQTQLADARLATGRYATDLKLAQTDGYMIITKMMPGMGYHYMNPAIKDFDVTRPMILVYEQHGNAWQLAALEWVFPAKPDAPPLEGATYGSFPAACHYKDGTYVEKASEAECAKAAPDTGASFNFWHPQLVTLHVWLWFDNPAGLYHGTNPLVVA